MSDSEVPLDELEEELLTFVEENKLNDKEKREAMAAILDSKDAFNSTRMKKWLTADGQGILKLLLEFMIRPTEKENLTQSLNLTSDLYSNSLKNRKDALLEKINSDTEEKEGYDSEDDMNLQFTTEAKRADIAAETFTLHFKDHHFYIENNIGSIINTLFRVFDVNSEGDFDNFDKVFHCCFTKYTQQIILYFTQNPTLVLHLLNYLEDEAIADTALSIMKTLIPQRLVVDFYRSLNSVNFFSHLGDKLYNEEKGKASYQEAGEFFMKLIELCCSYDGAEELWKKLGTDDGAFIKGLAKAVVNESGKVPLKQQEVCTFALKALLVKSGEQLFEHPFDSLTQIPLQNMLSGIKDKVHSYLLDYVPKFCDKLLRMAEDATNSKENAATFSTYTIQHKITFVQMALVDIIVELAINDPEKVLTAMGVYVWRVLSSWCFDHCFNNIYHVKFYTLFVTVVKSNHIGALKALLSKYKFVTRLIDHYMTKTPQTSGFRGFIIKIANYLRLKADSLEPNSFLRNFLISHTSWKEFLPILREETTNQLVTKYPAPSVSPLNQFSAFCVSRPLKPITPVDVSIDLGSSYANDLGFSGVVPYSTESASNTQKKRKRRRRRRKNNSKENDTGDEEEEEEEEEEKRTLTEKEQSKNQQQDKKESNTTDNNSSNEVTQITATTNGIKADQIKNATVAEKSDDSKSSTDSGTTAEFTVTKEVNGEKPL